MSIIKCGKDRYGVQREFNKETKKYVSNSKRATLPIKLVAIYLYYKGLTFRGVGDLLGFHNVTILNWFKEYKHLFEDFQPSQQPQYEHVEIDEMFTYLKKSLKKSTFGLQLTEKVDKS